jgi:hypothetical protein
LLLSSSSASPDGFTEGYRAEIRMSAERCLSLVAVPESVRCRLIEHTFNPIKSVLFQSTGNVKFDLVVPLGTINFGAGFGL